MSNEDDFDQLSDIEVWQRWIQSDEGKAREKLHSAFLDLENDDDVKKSTVCMDFLRLMQAFDPSDPSIENIQDIVDKLNEGFKKLRAMKNASLRHSKGREAKNFVLNEWQLYAANYNKNKSSFARVYVKLIKEKFDFVVTEKQIREVWLKNTPPASKQAGMPADG